MYVIVPMLSQAHQVTLWGMWYGLREYEHTLNPVLSPYLFIQSLYASSLKFVGFTRRLKELDEKDGCGAQINMHNQNLVVVAGGCWQKCQAIMYVIWSIIHSSEVVAFRLGEANEPSLKVYIVCSYYRLKVTVTSIE